MESPERGHWLVVDSRRVSFGEYRRIAPGVVTFCIAALLKLLRIRLRFPTAVAHDFRITRLTDAEMPVWARPPLYDNGRPLLDDGLVPCFAYTLDAIGSTVSLARAYVSTDGLLIAQVMVSLNITSAEGGVKRTVTAHMSCISRRTRGGFIATGTNRAHLDPPRNVEGEVCEAAGVDVLARHRERIAGAELIAFEPNDVEAELRAEHDEMVASAVARGLYMEPDEQEIATLRAQTPPRLGG